MLKHVTPALTVVILTVAIFSITKLPLTSPFRLQLALLSLIATIFYLLILKNKGATENTRAGISAHLISTTTLFIVGATGWFFSPFFFSLYLLPVLYSFIFTPATSLSFVTILVILFSFNIGEVDSTYYSLVILSLLTTIPLCLYLRKEYLKLKEAEKKILILESEHKNFQDIVDKVLDNKITSFAANIRQPINDTKQLAFEMKHMSEKKDFERDRERIITAADEAIKMLKDFEEEATGLKLVSHKTPNESTNASEPAQPTAQDSDQSLSKKP